jgi:hypothetical protein
MNPLFYAAAVRGLLLQRRECRACGERQYVPPEKRRETTRCQRCGKELPPPAG